MPRHDRTSLLATCLDLRSKLAQLLRHLARFFTAPDLDDATGLLPELQP
jgi:hypothetical protein